MTYAYPSNITNLVDMAKWTNVVTVGFFWPLILLGLFCILFFSFKSYSTERALATSSFITMIIAIMLGIIGLVSSYIVVLTIVIAGISVIVLRSTNNKEF